MSVTGGLHDMATAWGEWLGAIVVGMLIGIWRALTKIHRQTKTSNGKTLAQIVEDMRADQKTIKADQDTIHAEQARQADEQRRQAKDIDLLKKSVKTMQGNVSAIAIHVGVEERDRATSRRRRRQQEGSTQ